MRTASEDDSHRRLNHPMDSPCEAPKDGLKQIGGCEAVKEHIRLDELCFGEDARAFVINPPRGLLLVGIAGCGKSAILFVKTQS